MFTTNTNAPPALPISIINVMFLSDNLCSGKDEREDGWKEEGCKVIQGLDVSGTVEDVKTKIRQEMGVRRNIEHFSLYNGFTLLDEEEDIGELNSQSTLLAFMIPVSDRKLRPSTRVPTDDIWIVTGSNWIFKAQEVQMKGSVRLDLQHDLKFAVVAKDPKDGMWKGRSFTLEDDNATVHLDDGKVSVSPPGSNIQKVLEPEDEKMYDPTIQYQARREKKAHTAIAIAGVLMSGAATI